MSALEESAAGFVAAAGAGGEIGDGALARLLTAAVRLHAAKVEARRFEGDILEAGSLTATEAIVAVCALMRVADLNPFDVAMWYRRGEDRS